MKYPRVLFLAALVWRSALTPGLAASPQDLIEQMLPPEMVLPNAEAIGLAADQRETLQRETSALQARMGPLQQRMREETGVLVEMLAQAKPDEAAVLAQYEKLNVIENEVKRLRVKMTLRVKAMLTPEQQAKVHTLKSARAGNTSNSGPAREGIADKLQRVKQGIERWKREGRDVTRVRELWEQFQLAAEKRHHAEARRVLDEALAIFDAPQIPNSATPTPQP